MKFNLFVKSQTAPTEIEDDALRNSLAAAYIKPKRSDGIHTCYGEALAFSYTVANVWESNAIVLNVKDDTQRWQTSTTRKNVCGRQSVVLVVKTLL